jgi:hypothetical protein
MHLRSAALGIIRGAIRDANSAGPAAGALLGLSANAWVRVCAQARENTDRSRTHRLGNYPPTLRACLNGPFAELIHCAEVEIKAALAVWPHARNRLLLRSVLGESLTPLRWRVPDLRWQIGKLADVRAAGCLCCVCEAWRLIERQTSQCVPTQKQLRELARLVRARHESG